MKKSLADPFYCGIMKTHIQYVVFSVPRFFEGNREETAGKTVMSADPPLYPVTKV